MMKLFICMGREMVAIFISIIFFYFIFSFVEDSLNISTWSINARRAVVILGSILGTLYNMSPMAENSSDSE